MIIQSILDGKPLQFAIDEAAVNAEVRQRNPIGLLFWLDQQANHVQQKTQTSCIHRSYNNLQDKAIEGSQPAR